MTPLLLVWATYFIFGGFLELMTRKGGWDKYLLIKTNLSYTDYQHYLVTSCRDLFIILPGAYYLTRSRILLSVDESVVFYDHLFSSIAKVIASVWIGYVYRMIVHMFLHTKYLYKRFHSQHHVSVNKLNAFICFTDSVLENIVMEMVGVFILPSLLVPVPANVLTLIWTYGVYTGLLDHSCLYIHDIWWLDWIDCRYHIYHHLNVRANFAELELLDRLAGTYVEPCYT